MNIDRSSSSSGSSSSLSIKPVEELNPCCKNRSCRRVCEKNVCCGNFGKIGCIVPQSEKRPYIFLLAFILSVFSLGLRIMVCIGTSENAVAVKRLAWGLGDVSSPNHAEVSTVGKDFDLYIGANVLVLSPSNTSYDEVVIHWDDVDCNSTYCNDCKDASHGQVFGSYTSILGGIGQLATDYQRIHYATDYNCQKFAGVVSGLVGILSNLAILGAFQSACVESLNDDFPNLSADLKMGPGMIFILVSTFVTVVDAVCHAIVPTPDERHPPFASASNRSAKSVVEMPGDVPGP